MSYLTWIFTCVDYASVLKKFFISPKKLWFLLKSIQIKKDKNWESLSYGESLIIERNLSISSGLQYLNFKKALNESIKRLKDRIKQKKDDQAFVGKMEGKVHDEVKQYKPEEYYTLDDCFVAFKLKPLECRRLNEITDSYSMKSFSWINILDADRKLDDLFWTIHHTISELGDDLFMLENIKKRLKL